MDGARCWQLIAAVSHVLDRYGVTAVSHPRAGITQRKYDRSAEKAN
jgi:hypothetical protein